MYLRALVGRALALCLLCSFAAIASAARAAAAVPNILALGDSITYGVTSASAQWPGGYRHYLYQDLVGSGYAFRFVGTTAHNPSPELLLADQVYHDGHSGYRIDQLSENLDGHVVENVYGTLHDSGGYLLDRVSSPDIILLHIGTNDIIQKYDPGQDYGPDGYNGDDPADRTIFVRNLARRLDGLVGKLTSLRPAAHLIVASIIPISTGGVTLTQDVTAREYNALIRTEVVPKYQAAGKNVTFVDQYQNFIVRDPLLGTEQIRTEYYSGYDGVHPGPLGYEALGHAWAEAIRNLPPLKTAPEAPTNLEAIAVSRAQIDLSWSDNSGSESGFAIERSADNVTFSPLTTVGANVSRFSDTGLEKKTTYYYRVRAYNGLGNSAYTNRAGATTGR